MLTGAGRVGPVFNIRLSAFAVVALLAISGFLAAQGCFPPTAMTFLRLSSDETPGQSVTMGAYLYTIGVGAEGKTSAPPVLMLEGKDRSDPIQLAGTQQPVPVAKGLLIVSWGYYKEKTCYMVSGDDGRASAKFEQKPANYPDGGESYTYTVSFCPYVANHDDPTKPNQEWMANCARLRDANNKSVARLDYTTIPRCPGSDLTLTPLVVTDPSGSQTDLGDTYAPSTSFMSVRNSTPSGNNVQFCWVLAAIFGLLFSALMVSGRNPLYMFDLSATRNVRVNRNAGAYMPMTQNVAVSPVSVISAADRMGNMAVTAAGAGDTKKGADANLNGTEDDKGNKIPGAKQNNETIKNDKSASAQDKGAAAGKLADAQARYDTSGFSDQMQLGSQQGGYAANKLSDLANKGVGSITPFGSKDSGKEPGFFASVGNTISQKMVRMTAMALPGSVVKGFKSGKFRIADASKGSGFGSWKEFGKKAGREVGMETIKDVAIDQVGKMAQNYLRSMPEPLSQDKFDQELMAKREGIFNNALNSAPVMFDDEQKVQYANEATEKILQKESRAHQTATLTYAAESENMQAFQRLVSHGMTPLFDKLSDKWFGAKKPPRYEALKGWGGAFGVTLSNYLTDPVKYGTDAMAMQRRLEYIRQLPK